MAMALPMLTAADLASDSVRAGLEDGLGRSRANAGAIVELLARHYREKGITAASDGLTGLLMNGDANVRLEVIHHLTAAPPERAGLRDLLITPLSDQLTHPDPRIRAAAAGALVGIGYPQAPLMVAGLAYDTDPAVRQAAVELVERAGTYAEAATTAANARDVGVLLGVADARTGDERVRWLASLAKLAAQDTVQSNDVLAAALAKVPAGDADPFLQQAESELTAAILARSSGDDLLVVCRHMLERGGSGGEHAARLAGTEAATNPYAMDFLWTLYAESGGAWSEAARREIASLVGKPLDQAVRAELETVLAHTTDAARRDVLTTLLAR
jgi:hypothetical protein